MVLPYARLLEFWATSVASPPRRSGLQLRLRLPLCVSYCVVISLLLGWSSGIWGSTSQAAPVLHAPPPSQTSSGPKRITLLLKALFLTWAADGGSITSSIALLLHCLKYSFLPFTGTGLPGVWKYPTHPTHQEQIGMPKLQLEVTSSTAHRPSRASQQRSSSSDIKASTTRPPVHLFQALASLFSKSQNSTFPGGPSLTPPSPWPCFCWKARAASLFWSFCVVPQFHSHPRNLQQTSFPRRDPGIILF